MMRVGIRMLMNDDKDEDWKDVSHARAWGARRMTGSAGTVLDVVIVVAIALMGGGFGGGGEISGQVGPFAGGLADDGKRWYCTHTPFFACTLVT